jgi:hypothetical protein
MAAGDLVVNGVTYSLPAPMQNGLTEPEHYRGSQHIMGSGAPVWEFTSTTAYNRTTIEWSLLTAAQKAIVSDAVAALVVYGTGTYSPFTGGSNWTVTLGRDGFPDWGIRKVKGNTEFRYSGKLTLERTA